MALVAVIFGACSSSDPQNAPDNQTNQTDQPSTSQQIILPNGDPFFFIADTAWLLCKNIGEKDIVSYLEIRKSQGFNTIMVGVDGSWWDTPSSPKIEIWNKLSYVLEKAKMQSMYIIPTVQISEYNSESYPYLRLPESSAESMGEWIGDRYSENYGILFWMVGGLDEKNCISVNGIVNFANGIKSKDPNHLISYHPASYNTSIGNIPLGSNHQIILYQSYQDTEIDNIESILQALENTGFPFANIEPIYEGQWRSVKGSAEEVDQVALSCARFKVCGMTYGHHDIWAFNSNWKNSLYAPGVQKFINATKKAPYNK